MTDRIVILEQMLEANGRERPQTEFLKAASAALTVVISNLKAHNGELSRLCEEQRLKRVRDSQAPIAKSQAAPAMAETDRLKPGLQT
jgi:hypothetical protein